jgi:hypothetical protein
MAKVKKITVDGKTHYSIKCPACKVRHVLNDKWDFNGDYNKPTFTPSLDYTGGRYNRDESYTKLHCHSYIKDGKIQFLNDCSHDMKGQTVDLLNVE